MKLKNFDVAPAISIMGAEHKRVQDELRQKGFAGDRLLTGSAVKSQGHEME